MSDGSTRFPFAAGYIVAGVGASPFSALIIERAEARHNHPRDGGPTPLQARIVALIDRFLHKRRCDA